MDVLRLYRTGTVVHVGRLEQFSGVPNAVIGQTAELHTVSKSLHSLHPPRVVVAVHRTPALYNYKSASRFSEKAHLPLSH